MTSEELFRIAANGDTDAYLFLVAWCDYVHAIDDIIDEQITEPERIIRVFAMAHILYTMPFHLKWANHLKMLVVTIGNAYADSVQWEKGDGWRAKWADTLRFVGAEMTLAVAFICGGYEAMRALSPQLRETAWKTHHDGEEKPV